jgi:hypothetical protein
MDSIPIVHVAVQKMDLRAFTLSVKHLCDAVTGVTPTGRTVLADELIEKAALSGLEAAKNGHVECRLSGELTAASKEVVQGCNVIAIAESFDGRENLSGRIVHRRKP